MDNKFAKTLKKLQEQRDYVTDPYDQQSMYEEVAENVSLTPQEVAGIGGLESEHGKYNEAFNEGSARGTFQLMPNTMKYLKERLKVQGSEEEVNPLREEARLAAEMMKQNETEAKKTLGKDPTVSEIFIKHNLGAGMGKQFLKAPGSKSMEEILPEDVVKSNPSIYKGKTKSKALKEIQKRLDEKSKEFNFEDRSPLGFLKD